MSLAGKAQASSRCESRLSAASTNYLPDLEVDDNIELGPRHAEPAQLLVHRTASLLVTDLEAGSPGLAQVAAEMDVLAKREGVLRDIEDKKNQIREAKGTHFIMDPSISKMCFFSLVTKWADDSSRFWCDGLSSKCRSYGVNLCYFPYQHQHFLRIPFRLH